MRNRSSRTGCCHAGDGAVIIASWHRWKVAASGSRNGPVLARVTPLFAAVLIVFLGRCW
jgi:hypothetical protein